MLTDTYILVFQKAEMCKILLHREHGPLLDTPLVMLPHAYVFYSRPTSLFVERKRAGDRQVSTLSDITVALRTIFIIVLLTTVAVSRRRFNRPHNGYRPFVCPSVCFPIRPARASNW